jgi:hypothetical protein
MQTHVSATINTLPVCIGLCSNRGISKKVHRWKWLVALLIILSHMNISKYMKLWKLLSHLTCNMFFMTGSITCWKIVGVRIPPVADMRHPAILGCSYEEGDEGIFSVKWYKDDDEFFRYIPSFSVSEHMAFIIVKPLIRPRNGSLIPFCARFGGTPSVMVTWRR